MMKTRITKLLNIEYPVILASMAWICNAELVAAVSHAGGLGTIGPNAGQVEVTTDAHETGERLRQQIRRVRELTSHPFAVNFVVGTPGLDRRFSDQCVEVGIEEKVPVAVVSQGGPSLYTQRLKDAGIKVIHTCTTVEHCKKAEQAGADAVIVTGTEGGGHSGFYRLTTFCLVPQAVDAIKIPVISGGGIGDARGLVAALALGAEAVYMGTRFIATKECPAHHNVKQMILNAKDTSTISLKHGLPSVVGSGDSGFIQERRGYMRIVVDESLRQHFKEETYDEMLAIAASKGASGNSMYLTTCIKGDVSTGVGGGQVAGLVKDIPSCEELIQRIVKEAKPILKRLDQSFGKEK